MLFADVFEKCKVADADNKKKLRTREFIISFMEHLKNQGEINSFEVTKKGNKFYSVKFTYSRTKRTHT